MRLIDRENMEDFRYPNAVAGCSDSVMVEFSVPANLRGAKCKLGTHHPRTMIVRVNHS